MHQQSFSTKKSLLITQPNEKIKSVGVVFLYILLRWFRNHVTKNFCIRTISTLSQKIKFLYFHRWTRLLVFQKFLLPSNDRYRQKHRPWGTNWVSRDRCCTMFFILLNGPKPLNFHLQLWMYLNIRVEN